MGPSSPSGATSHDPGAAVGAPASTPRRVAWASAVGTTIEWYDFYLYATASALVFSGLFFPSVDPATGTLAAFATFAAGFGARPVGAVISGHLGDRVGRKALIAASLVRAGDGRPWWALAYYAGLAVLTVAAALLARDTAFDELAER